MALDMKQLSTIFHTGHWRWWRSRPGSRRRRRAPRCTGLRPPAA